jgi:hypothetical protein
VIPIRGKAVMVCAHLAALENELIAAGVRETARGQVWSQNCREWVYFDAVLELDALAARLAFDVCVEVHQNLDPRSGLESGFVCRRCNDAVMGLVDGERRYR